MIALKRASKGVTLVELIMVTAILSVLASVAYPAFADLRQAGAARSARSELTVAISQARSTAIMQRQNVIACPTSDQMRCSQDLHWQHGWLCSSMKTATVSTMMTKPWSPADRHCQPASPCSPRVVVTISATSPMAQLMGAT